MASYLAATLGHTNRSWTHCGGVLLILEVAEQSADRGVEVVPVEGQRHHHHPDA